MALSSADSFGTFLESVNRSGTPQEPSGSEVAFRLLAILLKTGPCPMPELMTRSGAALDEFLRAINFIRETGLIVLSGGPGQKGVSLTQEGEELARAAS